MEANSCFYHVTPNQIDASQIDANTELAVASSVDNKISLNGSVARSVRVYKNICMKTFDISSDLIDGALHKKIDWRFG